MSSSKSILAAWAGLEGSFTCRWPLKTCRSMLTLFQATTTEGWADIARKVMEKQPWTAGFFILYLHVGLEEPL